MRENMGLYRGKRRDTGEWVEGYLAGYDLICTEEPQDVRHATGEYYDQIAYVGFVEVDPATVGQFAGLLDKNGKRIFEGDVVRIAHDDWSFDGETIEHRVEEGFIDYDGSMTIGLVVEQYNGIAVRSPFFHLLALTDQIKDWSIEVIGTIHDKEKQNEGK